MEHFKPCQGCNRLSHETIMLSMQNREVQLLDLSKAVEVEPVGK